MELFFCDQCKEGPDRDSCRGFFQIGANAANTWEALGSKSSEPSEAAVITANGINQISQLLRTLNESRGCRLTFEEFMDNINQYRNAPKKMPHN